MKITATGSVRLYGGNTMGRNSGVSHPVVVGVFGGTHRWGPDPPLVGHRRYHPTL